MNFEHGGDTLAPKKQKYLPKKILDAADRVLEMEGIRAGIRVTLQTICKYVSKDNPLGPVFTRREKIAQRAGLSVASVNRHLHALKTLGYLRIENQRHGKRTGAFLVTHIFLTEALARKIGLVSTEIAVDAELPSLKMRHASIKKLTNPSYSKRQERPTLSEITVPEDLQPLLQMGVWPQTICKMMKDAQGQGKRLSDVFLAVRRRLETLKLRGEQIARYLRKVIATQSDFAALAREEQAKAQAAEQSRADALRIENFRARWKGQTLVSPDGQEVLDIAASGDHALHQSAGRSGTLPLCHIREINAIEKRLANGTLRVKTDFDDPVAPSQTGKQAIDRLAQAKRLLGLGRRAEGGLRLLRPEMTS